VSNEKGNRSPTQTPSLIADHGTPTAVIHDAELLRVSGIESTRNLYHVG
jgi:hypothetical protein